MLTNTEILCFILGWQGGTIHQVSYKLNVCPTIIIEAKADKMRELCRLAQQLRSSHV